MSNDDDLRAELAALRQTNAEILAALAGIQEKLAYREQVFVGWKAIGEYVGYSEDHCKELGQDVHDPIPHWHQGGMVAAHRTMLDAWLFRRRRPAQVRMKPEGRKGQVEMFDGPKTPKRGRATNGSAS